MASSERDGSEANAPNEFMIATVGVMGLLQINSTSVLLHRDARAVRLLRISRPVGEPALEAFD